MWITSSLSTAFAPTAIALGNFDGVHLGHQAVIRSISPGGYGQKIHLGGDPVSESIDISRLKGYSDRFPLLLGSYGFKVSQLPPINPANAPVPTVVTFYPHPREFFSGKSQPYLTPLAEKAAFMEQLGVCQLVLLPFNQELANLSPTVFVEEILLGRLQARQVCVGADFRFGHDRSGNVTLLEQLATQRGVQVTVMQLSQDDGERISSSRIRQALWAGDPTQAEQLLGRPYCLMGPVVQGQQLGRKLGFPTANLQVSPDKFLPRTGVYSVLVYGIPDQAPHQGLPGVMNLGVRPTVDGQTQTVEVHVLNWQGNLYDCTLRVALKEFLRPEQRFDSLDHLKAQIKADCTAAQAVLQVGN